MPPSQRRGSRVIYVASSARELPEEVRDWLGQAGNPAASSADIYDALALLATGSKPAAIIVSIDAVDWNELDFFDHAARLSSQTHIYVTGHEHQQAKIEAAWARGARPFDPEALSEDLDSAPAETEAAEPGRLLAGSLRAVHPHRRGVPEAAPRARRVKTDEQARSGEPPPRPPVRLVTEPEPADDSDTPVPVPVPWAPSPNRPKRTPPQAPRPPDESDPAPRAATPGNPAPTQPSSPVELTPEELSALLGKPDDPESGSVKEQRP